MKRIIPSAVLALLCVVGSPSGAAPFTNYLDATSNALASAYASSSSSVRMHRTLGSALGALRKRSSSVAGDLSMLSSINAKVAPLGTGTPDLALVGGALSNAFTSFVLEAEAEIGALSNRLHHVTPFHTLRRSASNQLTQAQSALVKSASALTFRSAITSVRLAYVKIAAAGKLTRRAEASPGPAPESLVGVILTHVQRGDRGVITFPTGDMSVEKSSDGYTEAAPYEYTRTGFTSGRLVLHHGDDSSTVNFRFSTAHRGTFNYRSVDLEETNSGSGTFTTAAELPPGAIPAALTGLSLHHESRSDESTNGGVTVFTSATEFSDTNEEGTVTGTYEYVVTGSNTATLVIHGDEWDTTVHIVFATPTAGYFFAVESSPESEPEGGTFTLGP
jgi:hypothetical protein